MYDDDCSRYYPQSVAPGCGYAHRSIPVESVYGEQMSECHTSQEEVVVSPNYSETPSFIADRDEMLQLMRKSEALLMDEHQLIKWDSDRSEDSTEELTDSNDPDDDDFENSLGLCCQENYRESATTVVEDQIVPRGLEPPGDPPEQEPEQQVKTLVESTPTKESMADIAELEAKIQNQLALLNPKEFSPTQDYDETIDAGAYNGYSHNFVTVKDEHRFLMLYTFLKRHSDQKIIIFFSTTKSTQYYSKLLKRLKFDVRAVHNGQTKEVFLSEYLEFSKQSSSGIMCIPDFQNEFAIPPSCDWIIQFEPPSDPNEYIFRIGRISIESSSVAGRALLFVTPEQFGVLQYFKAAGVKLREYEVTKISEVKKHYIALIRRDETLRKLAREACNAYLLAYASHSFRDVYKIHDLNEDKVALAFGFTKAPKPKQQDDRQKRGARKDLEDRRWKPVKSEKSSSWMRKEKTWRYADRHSSRKADR
jgi:ATP-dependent RNA helicase DDX18/HAS1